MLIRLELNLCRMLELFQLDIGSANYIDGLHEPLHAFPHVRDGHFKLVLELGCQIDFVF